MKWPVAVALVALFAGCVTVSTGSNRDAAPVASGPPLAFDVARPVYATVPLQPGYKPPRDSLEGALWMRTDSDEASLRTSGALVRDEKLNAYVRGLACKIAGPHCGDIRTYVVRLPAPNASMMPNGVMQVWTGLLLRARNEAQLMAVLGHETGHYLMRHNLIGAEDRYAKTNALVFGELATRAAGIPEAGQLLRIATLGSILAFSREHETEADDIGLKLLVQHGYDPREAANVWRQMLAEDKADKYYRRPSLFASTHPPTEERIDRLTRMAEYALPRMPSTDAARDRFVAAIAPHRALFLRDELNLRHFDTFEALLAQLADDGANLGEIRFFQGEMHRLRSDKGDDDKALKYYGQALDERDFPPAVYRSLGQVLHRMRREDEAKSAFQRYLELAPDAPDRDLIQMMIGPKS